METKKLTVSKRVFLSKNWDLAGVVHPLVIVGGVIFLWKDRHIPSIPKRPTHVILQRLFDFGW